MKELFGMNLTDILKSSVRESVDEVLDSEELKQKKAEKDLKPFKHKKKASATDSSNTDVDEAEDENSEKQPDAKAEPIEPRSTELPEINIQLVIDLIGAIRAGKSLKEKETLIDLKGYFDRLNGNERVALYAFLSGLSKVMANVDDTIDKESVPTPDSEPFKIDMKKQAPKVDDRPAKGEEAPIVVGEAANKSREMALIRSLLCTDTQKL